MRASCALLIEPLEPRWHFTAAPAAAALVAAPAAIGPSAAAFAHVYVVSPAGPYTTIGAAALVAGPGDLVSIAPGRYRESLYLTTSGQATRPITFAAMARGSVTIDGTGFKEVIGRSPNVKHIVLDGLKVDHAANAAPHDLPAVSTNDGWRVRNVLVQNAEGTGLTVFGNDVQLTRVTAKYNGRAGISGYECSNVLVADCATIGNNTRNNDPDFDGGAGKWFRTRNVTIRRNTLIGGSLSLRDWDRGPAFKMNDVEVTDNIFRQTRIHTEGGTWTRSSPASKAIVFDRNQYRGGISFNWGATTYTSLADVRATLGYERAGKVTAQA